MNLKSTTYDKSLFIHTGIALVSFTLWYFALNRFYMPWRVKANPQNDFTPADVVLLAVLPMLIMASVVKALTRLLQAIIDKINPLLASSRWMYAVVSGLLIAYLLLVTLTGCQTESLDIQAPYRIKLNVASPGQQLHINQAYTLPLELLTDSYYAKYGYALQFYQQTGLGQLKRVAGDQPQAVLQKVPVSLPLGVSSWQYTPGAVGTSQIVLVAQQERGYTQPDTVRLTFQIVP